MEASHPKWILDRKGSGFLFWRRENESLKQVKFRCDVQVVEFLRHEETDSSEDLESPSALVAALCLVIIAVVLSYQWLH